jgi:predicted metal-dependent phosphoesterase TrpH
MSPRTIARAAAQRGIGLIAVADHNTVSMVDPVAEAAAEAGLSFLYGIELQTREEVHLLAYFGDSAACHRFADLIYGFLPDRPNEPTYFGDQVIVTLDEEIVATEPKLLVNSLDLGLDEAVGLIGEHGGLPVPAHVDRETFGLIAQLGFPPENLRFDLVETVEGVLPDGFGEAAPICSSDAHRPEEIGRRTTRFTMNAMTTEEMVLAARGVGGRSVACVR